MKNKNGNARGDNKRAREETKMEWSVEDSKTIQRQEKESLGPYDSLKRNKVDDCRPVRGWRRGNQKENKEKGINCKYANF